MEEGNYVMPSIVWLRVTDYMQPWMQLELGGELRIGNQRVVSVQHLPGARPVLRMETVEEMLDPKAPGISMSATWKNCIERGLDIDPDTIKKEYGMTKETMKQFVPIECLKRCVTRNGVVRPWSNDVNFSKRQARKVQDLLRQAFWDAVEEFAGKYARQHKGERYAQVDMIEAFCAETGTPDLHVEAMRREWQRRRKRTADIEQKSPKILLK